MQCPHCQAENRPGARFCGRCGEALEVQPEPVQTTAVGTAPAVGTAGPEQIVGADEATGSLEAIEPRPSEPRGRGAHTPTAACATCGNPLKPGARFCGRCGSVVGKDAGHPGGPEVIPDAGRRSRSEPDGLAVRNWAAPVSPVSIPSSPTVREIPQQSWPAGPAPGTQGAPLRDAVVVAPPAHRPADVSRRSPADGGGQNRTARPAESRPARGLKATGRPAWLVAVVTAIASGACFFCVVLALAAGPAFGTAVPSLAPVDPTRPDLTILVEEAYIGDMVSSSLPDAIDGDATLDVQSGNLIVTTIDFQLLIVRLQVVVNSRIAVEEGRIGVKVESIETGGQDLLDLIGMDQLVLGEDITGVIQDVLEDELGEGVRLLAISTDEARVILTARWE